MPVGRREFAKNQATAKVLLRLNHYEGSNRLLQKWKGSSNMILGPEGVNVFAVELIKSSDALRSCCESWGFSEQASPYVQMAVDTASRLCLEQLDRSIEMRSFLFKEIIPWPYWRPDQIKELMRKVILFPGRNDSKNIELITHLVLSDKRFGDPRHPHNHINWVGIDDAAHRLQEWLSAADIKFFFEHVLPKGTDPHGRKTFWLRYVGCRGLISRPLLSDYDKYRLRHILKEKGAQTTHFGKLEGDTSAFVLDFGPVVVVEFSEVGNACYIYTKKVATRVVPDLWSAEPFVKTQLKRKSEIATSAPVRHDVQGRWREETERVLARFGVRAVA